MTTRITIEAPCRLCHGTIGSGTDGAHNLCLARERMGLKVVSLGHACPQCLGRGWWRADGGPPLNAALPVYSSPVEMERGLRAIFPPCQHCKGTGHKEN